MDPAADLEHKIRTAWAESIKAYMNAWIDPHTGERMSRKQLRAALAAQGFDVTMQTISMWLTAQTSPRPAHLVALARVFNAPPRVMFPLEVQ